MYYIAKVSLEGSRWLAEFPAAPGCATFSESEKELAEMARDAIHGWLASWLDAGDVPPEARRPPAVRRRDPRAGPGRGGRGGEVWSRRETGMRKQVSWMRRHRRVEQVLPREESTSGKPIPCAAWGDPRGEA